MKLPLSLLLFLLLLSACFGQDEIADSIRQLGDADFRLRQQAKEKLLKIGAPARPALEKAAEDPDFERAFAARALLKQILPGVSAETPEEVSQAVSLYVHSEKADKKQEAAVKLAACQPFPLDVFIALQQWETAENQHLLGHPFIANAYSRLQLLLAGREDLLQCFLFAGLKAENRHAERQLAIYLQRSGRLVAQRKVLMEKSGGVPNQSWLLYYLHWAAEDLPAARALLEKNKSKEPALYLSLLRCCGDWKTLAPLLESEIKPGDAASLLGTAAAYELAGDQEGEKRILEMLAQFSPADNNRGWRGRHQFDHWGWRNQQMFAQQAGWGNMGMMGGGWDFGYTGGRYNNLSGYAAWKTFCLYGLPGDAAGMMEDTNQAAFINMLQSRWLFPAAAQFYQGKIEEQAGSLFPFLQLQMLYSLGDEATMKNIDKEVEEMLSSLLGKTSPLTSILRQMHSGSLSGPVSRFLPTFLDEAFSKEDSRVGSLVFAAGQGKAFASLLSFWFSRLRKARPEAKNSELALLIHDFLSGRLEKKERQSILNLPWTTEETGEAPKKAELRVVDKLIETCLQLGLEKEAETACERLPLLSDVDPKQQMLASASERIARYFARREQWAQAALWFRKSLDLRPGLTKFAGLTLSQLRLDPKAGEGPENLRLLRLALLADATYMKGILSLLDDYGLEELFNEELDIYLQWNEETMTQEPFDYELKQKLARLRAAGDFSGEYRLAAAHWLHCVQFRGSSSALPGQLLAGAVEFRAAHARFLYFTGKEAEALGEVERAIEIMPAAVDPIGTTVRALDAMGKTEAADKVFSLSYERHHAIVEKLPNCAEILNGLAWLCSRSNRRLEEARDYARRAVKLQGWNDAYLNTLAELEFQLGDRKTAEKLNAECQRLNPYQREHRAQERRFWKK